MASVHTGGRYCSSGKKKSLLRVHASNLYTYFEYKVFREDFKLKGNFHHASNSSNVTS